MPTLKKKDYLLDNPEGEMVTKALTDIDTSDLYNTGPSYSADGITYPNNLIPFIDKHLNYLRKNQSVNPQEYLSNLRLMTKIQKR